MYPLRVLMYLIETTQNSQYFTGMIIQVKNACSATYFALRNAVVVFVDISKKQKVRRVFIRRNKRNFASNEK